MAVRSATALASSLKRRGGEPSAGEIIWLTRNEEAAQETIDVFKGWVSDAKAAEKKANEAEAAATARLTEATGAEAVFDTRLAAHSKAAEKAATEHQAGLDALNGRSRVVVDKESALDVRTAAADLRDKKFAADGLARETEYQATDEANEARETAADERDRVQQVEADGLKKRAETIGAIETMAKQIIAMVKGR